MKPIAIGTTLLASIGLLAVMLAACLTSACAPNAAAGSSTLPTASGTNTVASPAVPSQTDSTIEASLPLIRTGAAVVTGGILDFAVQQPATRTKLANEIYASANAVYTLTGGQFVTPTQLSNTLASYGQPGDAQYTQYVTALNGLYASYFAKIPAGDAKTATDVLNAIAGGIEDAAQSYVTTPAAPASTDATPPLNFICRLSSLTHPEMLRPEFAEK